MEFYWREQQGVITGREAAAQCRGRAVGCLQPPVLPDTCVASHLALCSPLLASLACWSHKNNDTVEWISLLEPNKIFVTLKTEEQFYKNRLYLVLS